MIWILFILLEAVSIVPRIVWFFFLLASVMTLVPLVPFDVSHDSGLSRFPLACMGPVFCYLICSVGESDVLCVTETITIHLFISTSPV